MIEYCREHDYDRRSCLFVDDKKIMLQDAEMSGFQVMYPQQLLVDYYEYLKVGKPQFYGEYMSQYSWAEETCALLERRMNSKT